MGKECRQRRLEALINVVLWSCRPSACAGWLLRSWPWWVALGLILVPFSAQLRPLVWGLFLVLLLTACRRGAIPVNPARALMLLLVGVLWGSAGGALQLVSALPADAVGKDCWLTGAIADLPSDRGRFLRFRLRVSETRCEGRASPFAGDLLLSWYQPWPELEPGQRWKLKARLKPIHGSLNPGAFNYHQWLFAGGIDGTGYVREPRQARQLGVLGGYYHVERYRATMVRFIRSTSLANAGLINALATGTRDGISDAQWRVLRRTGTAHLVAISGLHVGMVAALGYIIGLWLWRWTLLGPTRYPAPLVAAMLALALATLYAGLAGFSLPTSRALLMLLAYFLLSRLQRNPGIFFTLGFVLLAVLLLDPLAPLGGSLWLSFGAVMSIAYATRFNRKTRAGQVFPNPRAALRERWKQRLSQWWQVQLAVTVGLFPLTLYLFQQVSLVSLPANMLAIPLVAFLVVPLILLAIGARFWGLDLFAGELLRAADLLLGGLWRGLEVLSNSEFSAARLPVPEIGDLLLLAAGFGVLFRSTLGRWRWLGALAIVPLVWGNGVSLEDAEYRVDMLDVGQGLAILVRTRDHALLYDAGIGYPDGFNAGKAIVLPFLGNQGVRRLDAVVASHDNSDHVGGVAPVVERFPNAALYASGAFYPRSRACEQGTGWEWDGVRFGFVHPPPGETGSGNNDSCVLLLESRFGRTLLSGDIERSAERRLLDEGAAIDAIDVLVVPHHGSRSSSTPAFVARTDPRLGLVSAGYLSRFNHPHPDVVQRYRQHGVALMNTAESGWIGVVLGRRGINAVPYRAIYRRYWLPVPSPEGVRQIHLPARST